MSSVKKKRFTDKHSEEDESASLYLNDISVRII